MVISICGSSFVNTPKLRCFIAYCILWKSRRIIEFQIVHSDLGHNFKGFANSSCVIVLAIIFLTDLVSGHSQQFYQPFQNLNMYAFGSPRPRLEPKECSSFVHVASLANTSELHYYLRCNFTTLQPRSSFFGAIHDQSCSCANPATAIGHDLAFARSSDH